AREHRASNRAACLPTIYGVFNMYRRILVPTDGSDAAASGLREAIKLARDRNAQIRIIHVVDESVRAAPHISATVLDQIINQFRATGKSVLASAKALVEDAGIDVDTQLVEAVGGHAGEFILTAAKEWPAD